VGLFPTHDPPKGYRLTKDDYDRIVALVKSILRTSGGKGVTAVPGPDGLLLRNPEPLQLTSLGPTVLGGYTGDTQIPPFRCVELTGTMGGNTLNDWLTPPIMAVSVPKSDDPEMWGITADRLYTNSVADIYTGGIVPCRMVRPAAVPLSMWARPTEDQTYLTADPYGTARVLAEEQVADKTKEHWCLVHLNAPNPPRSRAQWFHFYAQSWTADAVWLTPHGGTHTFVPPLSPHGWPFLAECKAGYVTAMRASVTGVSNAGTITAGSIVFAVATATQADTRSGGTNTFTTLANAPRVTLDATHHTNITRGGAGIITEGDGLGVYAGTIGLTYSQTYRDVDAWVQLVPAD